MLRRVDGEVVETGDKGCVRTTGGDWRCKKWEAGNRLGLSMKEK